MEVLSPQAHQTLAYIRLLEDGGAFPTASNINEFYRASRMRITQIGASRSFDHILSRMLEREDESPTEYLTRLGWIRCKSTIGRIPIQTFQLTDLSRALVRALASSDSESPVIEAVLDVDNPFAYAQTIAYLRTDSAPGLLVDPYLRLEQLISLQSVRSINRILVGDRLSKETLEDLARGSAVIRQDRDIKIRSSNNVHDRYLIPETEKPALMLGGSLNTIGSKLITITTLSDEITETLRARYDEIWAEATPVALPSQDSQLGEASPEPQA